MIDIHDLAVALRKFPFVCKVYSVACGGVLRVMIELQWL